MIDEAQRHQIEQDAITAAYEAEAEDEAPTRKFSVVITRDTTESCVIEIEAESEDEAHEVALERLSHLEDPGWEQDDTPNASADPYITGCEEIVPEGVQPMREFIVEIGRDARVYYQARVEARSISEVKAMVGRRGYTGEIKGSWVQTGTDDFDDVETAAVIDIETNEAIESYDPLSGWTKE